MARHYRLWENAQVVQLLPPAADAAGRTSSYISVKFGHKVFIVCEVAQGNAAQVTLTPLQAKDSSGTSSKAIGSAPIAANLDSSQATGSDQFTFPSAAASYQTDAGLKNKVVIFELDPAEVMDLANGFTEIAIQTSASNAANITAAQAIITPLRDARANPPTTYV